MWYFMPAKYYICGNKFLWFKEGMFGHFLSRYQEIAEMNRKGIEDICK